MPSFLAADCEDADAGSAHVGCYFDMIFTLTKTDAGNSKLGMTLKDLHCLVEMAYYCCSVHSHYYCSTTDTSHA